MPLHIDLSARYGSSTSFEGHFKIIQKIYKPLTSKFALMFFSLFSRHKFLYYFDNKYVHISKTTYCSKKYNIYMMNIFQRSILMCNSALNYEYLFVLLLQYFIPRVQHGLCPGLRRWPNICGKDPDISFNTGLQDLKVWFFALSTDACVFIVRNSMMALSIIERVIPKGWSCGGQFC